jgi:hypothetical protein
MSDAAIKKPTVFLSHAATDQPIVQVLHDEIKRVFANGVDVFASSVPGELQAGDPWLDRVNEKLRLASAVIVLITPISLNRPWIWFEVGASWSRMEDGKGRILPVCVPEIDKGSLPEPLSRLHAMSLGKAAETKAVFEALVDLFGFGNLKGFKYAAIKAKLPRYDELRVADSDLRSGAVYTGPYEGYSDDELAEVLDDQLLKPAWKEITGVFLSGDFDGRLLHFRAIDEQYRLPPGTAARLLPDAAIDRCFVKIRQRTPNTIRFELDKAEWEHAQLQWESS